VKNESVETQDRDNVFTLRVFPGDASTPPPLLDPALQSLASGSPLSRTDLTGGSTLLLSCQTQPHRFRKGPVSRGPVREHRVPGAKSRHDLLVNTLCVVGAPATVNKRNTILIKRAVVVVVDVGINVWRSHNVCSCMRGAGTRRRACGACSVIIVLVLSIAPAACSVATIKVPLRVAQQRCELCTDYAVRASSHCREIKNSVLGSSDARRHGAQSPCDLKRSVERLHRGGLQVSREEAGVLVDCGQDPNCDSFGNTPVRVPAEPPGCSCLPPTGPPCARLPTASRLPPVSLGPPASRKPLI
jgi:hypothetical protein